MAGSSGSVVKGEKRSTCVSAWHLEDPIALRGMGVSYSMGLRRYLAAVDRAQVTMLVASGDAASSSGRCRV